MSKEILKDRIGIIGLGYVGLPLAIEFSKFFKTLGFDKNIKRINKLKINQDDNFDIMTTFKKKKSSFYFQISRSN